VIVDVPTRWREQIVGRKMASDRDALDANQRITNGYDR
jgi:hypothetical protein